MTMPHLLKYRSFLESISIPSNDMDNLMESLKMWHDIILTSIGAQIVDIFDELKIPKSEFKDRLDIEILKDDVLFFNSLRSLGLRKSSIQKSDEFETFVNKPCRFMMIYDFEANDLENPRYILFQGYNETLKKWDDAKLYKLTEDVKKFYDKLSSKTIEIVDGDANYIYTTSNGNDWELQNLDSENDTYKRFFRKEELQSMLDSRGVTVNII